MAREKDEAMKPAPEAPAPLVRSALRENVESILVAVLFAIFVRGFVAQPYKIPSGSMKENLLVGDHLVVNKVVFGTDPTQDGPALLPTHRLERGDVVIFRPPHEPDTDYIKRVIGLPGEELTLTYSPKRNGVRVLVDGSPLPESYRTEKGGPVTEEPGARWVVNNTGMPTELRQGWAVRHFQLGADQYLMLGDNRNESADSRFWPDPAVPGSNIRGRAWFIYWSYEVDEAAAEPRTFGQRVGHYASIVIHFFTRSRWSRTFDPIGLSSPSAG